MQKSVIKLILGLMVALLSSLPVLAQEAVEETAVICVNAFVDENSNGLHDTNEGFMAGITFTIRRGEEVIGEGISNGRDEPICFPGLAPDTYQVLQEVPSRLVMTTANAATIAAEAQKSYAIEFGSRLPDETLTNSGVAGPQTIDSTAPILLVATPSTGTANPASLSTGEMIGLLVLGLGIIGSGILIFVGLRG